MIDIEITDKMWWRMCDCNMSRPTPIHQADLTKPFVYERRFGVFYVPSGSHQAAMSLLLAWLHNCKSGPEVAEKLNIRYSERTAELWLQMEGTAFRSSVGKKVQAGQTGNLNAQERKLFGPIEYILDTGAES